MGVRDRYDYTDAVLHHSLFTRWLRENGMTTDKKDESTRDVICMDFGFKVRSYEQELEHIKAEKKKYKDNAEKLQLYETLEEKVYERKELFCEMSKDEIRHDFYVNGVTITYEYPGVEPESIHYRMLYRNPSKAKVGQVMMIREELYEKARDWLTMGLAARMPTENAKIVELSAYSSLAASAIEGTLHMPIENVLILKDQDSFFHTVADIVYATDYELPGDSPIIKKRCAVKRQETDVKNTLWDGMALIESSSLPLWCNGMALLRNHFFKACAFKTFIQKFFKDYCAEHGIDYETYQVTDMFGIKHFARDIQMITTDNAIKWKKFSDIMDNDDSSLLSSYQYWKKRVQADGEVWGIVKTDHPSKIAHGKMQQMSYQMINTLPCTEEDIRQIAQTSIDYVTLLKNDNDEFEKYLRLNANEINHFEMLADLYAQNHDFANSQMWKEDKSKIISRYVARLRKGKIVVEGDNLTVCGNPYALLLYVVGEDWEKDPTLQPEDGVIQVYTRRFEDGEYLCGIRNPHNSSNNLGYFKNIKHPLMDRYFDFSNNIMAVNCIHTDVQARLNGCDFDSDFFFTTNQKNMVSAAKRAYVDYPTVVNEIPESSLTYKNTMEDYALMDSRMQGAQKAIGGSSDSAQLSQSYYWTKIAKNEYDAETEQLYENTVVLAVLAQVAIDGCKKVFAIDVNDEIARIRGQACMRKEKDYPDFMKYTREIKTVKNGKERPYAEIRKEKNGIKKRVDNSFICPMNWLQKALNEIPGSPKGIIMGNELFLANRPDGKIQKTKVSKICSLVKDYEGFIKLNMPHIENYSILLSIAEKNEEIIERVQNMSIGLATVYRIVQLALGFDTRNILTKELSKHSRKLLNTLYKSNKEKFLQCFIKQHSA